MGVWHKAARGIIEIPRVFKPAPTNLTSSRMASQSLLNSSRSRRELELRIPACKLYQLSSLWKRKLVGYSVRHSLTSFFLLISLLIFVPVERKMVSPIGREVDRGGGSVSRQNHRENYRENYRENHRAWECNELLHKRVSERHTFRATETFDLIGMAKHGKRKEPNAATPASQLISRFYYNFFRLVFLAPYLVPHQRLTRHTLPRYMCVSLSFFSRILTLLTRSLPPDCT